MTTELKITRLKVLRDWRTSSIRQVDKLFPRIRHKNRIEICFVESEVPVGSSSFCSLFCVPDGLHLGVVRSHLKSLICYVNVIY